VKARASWVSSLKSLLKALSMTPIAVEQMRACCVSGDLAGPSGSRGRLKVIGVSRIANRSGITDRYCILSDLVVNGSDRNSMALERKTLVRSIRCLRHNFSCAIIQRALGTDDAKPDGRYGTTQRCAVRNAQPCLCSHQAKRSDLLQVRFKPSKALHSGVFIYLGQRLELPHGLTYTT
jgi:hypothetical protein